ncbi:hypothetical protein FB563_0030 [Streptomyces puniciscabiei]|uniref:Uncharacterized protein n=1 Tax=Streptomyces puniciscabiei TaxID=164348 RepID=A0A542U7W8_9ACTN|nr:hypothetical protein [Streptomyces puniciscabiei]TQK95163.1 hypothetical protein FB563_0030 [Streptomyces puniciscabiei]
MLSSVRDRLGRLTRQTLSAQAGPGTGRRLLRDRRCTYRSHGRTLAHRTPLRFTVHLQSRRQLLGAHILKELKNGSSGPTGHGAAP